MQLRQGKQGMSGDRIAQRQEFARFVIYCSILGGRGIQKYKVQAIPGPPLTC